MKLRFKSALFKSTLLFTVLLHTYSPAWSGEGEKEILFSCLQKRSPKLAEQIYKVDKFCLAKKPYKLQKAKYSYKDFDFKFSSKIESYLEWGARLLRWETKAQVAPQASQQPEPKEESVAETCHGTNGEIAERLLKLMLGDTADELKLNEFEILCMNGYTSRVMVDFVKVPRRSTFFAPTSAILENRLGSCVEYSRVFSDLSNALGLETKVTQRTANGPMSLTLSLGLKFTSSSMGGLHWLNLVKLDEKYYFFDVMEDYKRTSNVCMFYETDIPVPSKQAPALSSERKTTASGAFGPSSGKDKKTRTSQHSDDI